MICLADVWPIFVDFFWNMFGQHLVFDLKCFLRRETKSDKLLISYQSNGSRDWHAISSENTESAGYSDVWLAKKKASQLGIWLRNSREAQSNNDLRSRSVSVRVSWRWVDESRSCFSAYNSHNPRVDNTRTITIKTCIALYFFLHIAHVLRCLYPHKRM